MMQFTTGGMTLGLLLFLVTPSLGQKVPYSEWYVNRTIYPLSRFGDPPEARGRMNPMGYRNYLNDEETKWNSKCNVSNEAEGCVKSETAWYYDIKNEFCATSPYGSCSGTQNNFKTKEQCDLECAAFSPGKAMAIPVPVPVPAPDPVTQPVSTTPPGLFTQPFVATTAQEKQPVAMPSTYSAVNVATPATVLNTEVQMTAETNFPVVEPPRYVAPGIFEIQTTKKPSINTQDLSCGHRLHKLAGVYLQQHAGVPRPISMHDNATRSAEKILGHYIDEAATEQFNDCSDVEIDRTKWLSTEVEHTTNGGVIIYQIGIQIVDFELP